ncbi:hypothetical protein CHUAL_001963 [Chamberlinius hualienensis]
MESTPTEYELRIKRSLQKLDLPEWYKKSSNERLVVTSNKEKDTSVPRWTDVRQRRSWAWSTSSSFKRQQQHPTGSVSASASGRQSKESLLQSPMSPSSIGIPWSSTSYYFNRPHSAFNYYSYQTGYSSTSVSRCSSSRSTSPTASISLQNPTKPSYKQPYLGWRSSEKLAREITAAGATSFQPTTPTTSSGGYFYRSPAERLSKGPGYYAMKFGMYQHHKPTGNYVRQMVEEIERATKQQQLQQQPQKRAEITVNVIGPSPSDLVPSSTFINGDEDENDEGCTQVEDMVREMGKLIHQNGENGETGETEDYKNFVQKEETSPALSEKTSPIVWMESSFVGVKPSDADELLATDDTSLLDSSIHEQPHYEPVNIIHKAQMSPLSQQHSPIPNVTAPESPKERSLSNTTMEEVLDSLLALPSTSSNRNSPSTSYIEPWQPSASQSQTVSPKPNNTLSELAESIIPTIKQTSVDNDDAQSCSSSGSCIDEESHSSSSSCANSATHSSANGCSSSSASNTNSASSVSHTAATTVCSSSTGCSDTSCNQESHCSNSHCTEQQEEPCQALSCRNSISVSTEESIAQNEELSECSGLPPPPTSAELHQLISSFDEELAMTEQVIQADEQPLSGIVRGREWRGSGNRRSLRPDYLDDSSLVQCSRENCEKTAEMREARHLFKTCHNCYTFYCSRDCRKEHWEKHRLVCMFGRVRSLCKQSLQYSRDNGVVLQYLSKIAQTGLLTQGRGFVKLLFRNTDMAFRFLREGWPQLEDGPIYVGWRNFLPEEMGDEVYKVVIQLCQTYDPQLKFILVVAIFVTREVPIRSVPHWEREIIAKCAKLSIAKNCTPDHINNTLVLTGPSVSEGDGMSAQECRIACLESIEYRLRERGVNLRLNFPDVFHRLCSYVENDESFPPITIYPKDGNTGQIFMCVIMPNSGTGTNSNLTVPGVTSTSR